MKYSTAYVIVKRWPPERDQINLLIDMLMDYNDKMQEFILEMLPDIEEQIDRQGT